MIGDECGGIRLPVGQLGMLVQIAIEIHEITHVPGDRLAEVLGGNGAGHGAGQ